MMCERPPRSLRSRLPLTRGRLRLLPLVRGEPPKAAGGRSHTLAGEIPAVFSAKPAGIDYHFRVKALVKTAAEPGLWLRDVPEPTIGINDVLIRVLRTGICGTDLHIFDWNEWAQQTIPVPMVIGHEFVGEIVDVGANVNDFQPGQLVSGEGHVVCGRCRNCMAGRRHLCAHTSGVGGERAGSFAEFVALPMSNIWRHETSVDSDTAQ